MKMSGLNGSGEMSLGNLKVEIAESNIATLFAQDIVNEVLQKALTIVTQVHDAKLTTYNKNHIISEYVKRGIELCDVTLAEVAATHPALLKMETEKTDALSTCKELPGRGGVGDQPIIPRQNSEVEVSDQPAPQECVTAAPVEKKSRVADLVKSSKQILSAYILDEKTKKIRDALEEGQEQLVQVIELEDTKAHFKAYKKIQPEAVPLPQDDDEDDFQQITAVSDAMDTIDLNEHEKKQPLDVIPEIVRDDGPSQSAAGEADAKEKQKKKWKFGARIMQFIKRPKQKARGTQTVTRK